MKIRVGTRKSKLALIQTELVISALRKIDSSLEIEIVPISTTGDKILDKNLYDIGGKALFLKEIEQSLMDKKIDIGVHSLKDVPGILPKGLEIVAVLEREDPRDVFISTKCQSIENLPEGAIIGSSSVRRRVIVNNIRSDLKVVQHRGTVQTRLDKVLRGDVDAAILAAAGLSRLGLLDSVFCYPISPEIMLPAAGQGTIAVEIREDNDQMREILKSINHEDTWILSQAERSFLAKLDASCRTPISAYAVMEYGRVKARYMHSDFEGNELQFHTELGAREDAMNLGIYATQKMDL